jgi:hypothetical protein
MANETKKKISFQIFNHAKYDVVLDELRHKYEAEEENTETLRVPYIITCAAALECLLNDRLIEFCYVNWKEKYKSIAESYISMSFRRKLISLFPILTHDSFRINQEHQTYRRLCDLIRARNKLMHGKSFLQEIELLATQEPKTDRTLPDKMMFEIAQKSMDMNFGLTDGYSPVDYHEAISDLETTLWDYDDANNLGRSDLVIDNTDT